jgi:hypothetical protein
MPLPRCKRRPRLELALGLLHDRTRYRVIGGDASCHESCIDVRAVACTEQIEAGFAGWPRADRDAPLTGADRTGGAPSA